MLVQYKYILQTQKTKPEVITVRDNLKSLPWSKRCPRTFLTLSAFQSIPGEKSAWLKFLQKEQHVATGENQILRKSFHRYSIEMNPFRGVGRDSILFNSAVCRKLDGFSVCVFSSFIPPS
ncbi:hypothetical protein CDAR_547471 [Caerostris darwini]|uniref:Uncharacterized protein n=1 Tax=Caerostris darwini TaxID=1538125 RepID=A0AAV4PN28_9ARAC|nr:hypothetical protein CDAR_547471 [Caerostris darwini]